MTGQACVSQGWSSLPPKRISRPMSLTTPDSAPRDYTPQHPIRYLLAALIALGPFTMSLYTPSMPAIALALATSDALVQTSIAIFLVAVAAGQLVYGPLSDRYGRRPILFMGYALFILASIICALAQTIDQLLMARFLQGLGASSGAVMSRAIIRDLFEKAANVVWMEGRAAAAWKVAESAESLRKKIDDLEADEKIFNTAQVGAQEALDSLADAVQVAEDALNWATGALEDAGEWLEGAGEKLKKAGESAWNLFTGAKSTKEQLDEARDAYNYSKNMIKFYEDAGIDSIHGMLPKAYYELMLPSQKKEVEKWEYRYAAEQVTQSDVDKAKADYDKKYFDFT